MTAGKGDKPRPVDRKKWSKNYDAIKWNKPDKEVKRPIKYVRNLP